MKKIFLMVFVIGISFPVLAQQTQQLFEDLTEKYSDRNGFSASMLSRDMFDLYLKNKNVDESSDVSAALKNLDNILVVSQSKYGFSKEQRFFDGDSSKKSENPELSQLHEEILAHYKTSGFSLLKTEKQMGEDIKVYLKKNNEKIESLALVTNSSASTNLVELNGDIDLSTVASLNKAINLRGLEALYKIDNSGSYYRRYPSFEFNRQMTEERVAEMEARARELAEKHAQLSEEQIQKIEEQAQEQAHKQLEMAEKYREMAEQYGRQPIFLSTPGDTNTVYYIDGEKVKATKVKDILKGNEVKTISKTNDEKKGKTVIRITTK